MRKLKILLATLAATMLVASPAFAATFDADVGSLTDTSLQGAGFGLEIDGS